RTIRLWETASGKEIARLEGHTAAVRGLAVSADGRRAVSGGADNTVRLWDLDGATPRPRGAFQGHTGALSALVVSPDGRTLLTGSADETVGVWDFGGAQARLRTLLHPGGMGAVQALALSPDGRTLAIAGRKDTIWLGELTEDRLRWRAHLTGHRGTVQAL